LEFIRGNQFTPDQGHSIPQFNQEACDKLLAFIKENSTDDVAFLKETESFHNYIKDNLITIHKTK
jgi:hypothetical protein